MKRKLLFSGMVAFSLAVSGCAKIDPSEPTAPVDGTGFNHATLSFENEEAMQEALMELVDMTDAQRDAWYFTQNQNFLCQQDAMWAVVDELDTCADMDEVRACQDKYSGIFLFNDNEEEEDISPYIPHDVSGLSLLLNAYGEVTVGGKTVNLNEYTSYGQTDYANCTVRLTKGMIEQHNRLYIETANRKMWAEAKWAGAGHDVFIHYVAHKKTLGWNKYKTDYHVAQNYIVAVGGVETFAPFYKSVKDNMYGLWRGELASGTDDRCFTPTSGTSRISYGYIIYSRGVGESNAGTLKIYYER